MRWGSMTEQRDKNERKLQRHFTLSMPLHTKNMLLIQPIPTKKEQQELCLRCGVTFDPDMLAYRAVDDGVFVGICQFIIRDDKGILRDLKNAKDSNDRDALFIMGRQTLNFIDLCGIHQAEYRGLEPDDALLRRIGFHLSEDGSVWRMDLTGFFDGGTCKHFHTD